MDNMTCTQWQALGSAAFPESHKYTKLDWHTKSDWRKIADKWSSNKADAIWGSNTRADEWLERESFNESCGALMETS